MAINISNIEWIGPTTTPFDSEFTWEISFDCIQELRADLEWKVTYVGSPEDNSYDQILESIPVGPIPVGSAKFQLSAPPPDPSQIPSEHALGATIILLGCSYVGQEFISVGFFLSNEYDTKELNEHPPARPNYSRMVRNIAADKPKVTRYVIDWTRVDPNYEKEIEELNQHLSQPQESNLVEGEGDAAKQDREFLAATSAAFSNRETKKPRSDFLPLFPNNVSLQIFSYLDIVTLARSRRVSPSWRKIVDSGLNLTRIVVNFPNVGALLFAQKQSSTSMESLNLSGTEVTDQILQSWLSQSGKQLKEIYLEDCKRITEKATDILLNHSPEIRSIFVGRSAISSSDPIARILKQIGTQIIDLSLDNVTSQDLEEIIKVCGPKLEYLEIPHSESVDDKDLGKIVKQCPKLKTLNVVFCPKLSYSAVEAARKDLDVVSSISSSDFTVELSKFEVQPEEYQVKMVFKIGDEVAPPSYITPLLGDEVPGLDLKDNEFVYDGVPSDLQKNLQALGFEVIVSDDWEENLEDESDEDDEDEEEDEGEEEGQQDKDSEQPGAKRQKVE